MCEIVADFARLNKRPGFDGESIPLGTDRDRPELAALTEGQQVMLIEPGNLRAEGRIVIQVVNGTRFYYGIVVGRVMDDAA